MDLLGKGKDWSSLYGVVISYFLERNARDETNTRSAWEILRESALVLLLQRMLKSFLQGALTKRFLRIV